MQEYLDNVTAASRQNARPWKEPCIIRQGSMTSGKDIGRKCVYISNMKAVQHHLRTTACGLGFGFQAGSKEQCGQAAGSLKPHAMIACEGKHRMKNLVDIAIRRHRPSARLQPDRN